MKSKVEKKLNAEHLVELLNGILSIDNAAVTALVNKRVDCNEDIASERIRNNNIVGIVGLLNKISDRKIIVKPDTETGIKLQSIECFELDK